MSRIEMTNSFLKAVRPVAHLIVGAFVCYTALVIPQAFLPNLLIGSLCEGESECSDVIYLAGALQLGMGIGGVVMGPILGGLSDSYGRKPTLLLIFVAAILPQALLACIKTKIAIYIWFFLALIAYTIREGGFSPTLLAAVADVVDENHRPAVNGLTIGSLSISAIGGLLASMLLTTVDQALWFYFIAAFGYGEKQVAAIFLLAGGGSALGMMIVYPVLSQFLGERVVLWVGLLANAGQYLLYGLAWTPWLPFVAAGIEVLHAMTRPALGTMVSRGVDREQQGKIQGFMSSVRSAATILAPLTMTPLTAASLGENPPFGLMGFPFIVCAFAMVLAWFISSWLPPLPPLVHSEVPTEHIQAPMPPVEDPSVPPPN